MEDTFYKNWVFAFVFMVGACILSGASDPKERAEERNPILEEYQTPFDTPPFEKIKDEHFLPAFHRGLELQDAEIRAIILTQERPSFENTIVALERSGSLLTKVKYLFSNMLGARPSEALIRISGQVFPLLSQHDDAMMMDSSLFRRIQAVYEMKSDLKLNAEQKTLLDKTYREFVRAGALLDEKQKAELTAMNTELSRLTQTFGNHLSAEKNAFRMILDDKEDLAGLPDDVVEIAAETANAMGHQGKWAFTLQGSSLNPFLKYSQKRHLRERMYKASVSLCSQMNEFNNEDLVVRITNLRAKKARILGYGTYADFILEESMVKSPDSVYSLLRDIWAPALEKAKKEAIKLQAFINRGGGKIKLEPWDWAFYAERLKSAENNLDEQELKPFFKLENVREGAFFAANKLFGLSFIERPDIPRYHKDVQVFEVREANGSHVGVFYVDFLTRTGKMYAGYMNYYRKESRREGRRIAPVITNVENFSKPAGGPAFLSLDEVKILFHEFGHCLHELLSDCTYESLSGTSTARDFVEMPARLMERWALQPEVLRVYAKHYQTGKPIPQELIDKIQVSLRINQGYDVVGFAASSFLDMDWHTLEEGKERKCRDFERAAMDKIGLIPEVDPRYRSTYFVHIFDGSYSASYYSYLWSEVLAADAFEAFQKAGLFDQATALSLRKNILEKGGSEDAGILFKRFRGGTPGIGPFLRARGLLDTSK